MIPVPRGITFANVRRARRVLFAHLYGVVLGASIFMGVRDGWDHDVICGVVLPFVLAGWHFNDAMRDA